MTWCFECQLDQKSDHLALCKELGHDIDSERSFQITNNEVKKMKGATEIQKENPVQKLAKFATSEMIKVVVSQSNSTRVFAVVKVNNHYETIELDKKNQRANHWLMVQAFDKLHEMYSEETCANTIGFLKAKTLMNEKKQDEEIYLRLAYVADEIYYDLGQADWKLIKISKDGISFVDYGIDTPVFIRTSKIAKQVEPNLKPEGNSLDEFVRLCRIPNPELFKVHLITMFMAGISIPLMAFFGPAGASKSTISSMIKRIVDPSGSNSEDNLKSFPHGEDNFVVSLSGSYFSAYENISHIDVDVSNMLCRAVTGASFEKRTQYTNDDVYTISVKRKILLNGIDYTISQSDLLDRTIHYEMERIPKNQRKTDKFVDEAFRKLLPDILGEIFLVLQKILPLVSELEKKCLNNERMGDFGVFGEAIYQAMGHKEGEFLDLYKKSVQKNLDNLYENNPVILCLQDVLDGKDEIEIQANDLYKRIRNYVDSQGYNTKRIPQASNGLYNWFTRSKPLLDDNNLKVTKYTNKMTKEASGFTPNATIFIIKRITSKQTKFDNELDM